MGRKKHTHNKDFRQELPVDEKYITYVSGAVCPKCRKKLVVLYPNRIWCESNKCNYGELHLVGNSVQQVNSYKIFRK